MKQNAEEKSENMKNAFTSAEISGGLPASQMDAHSPSADGSPSKRVPIFDRSNLEYSESGYHPQNSLYDLEHNNSMMRGLRHKPLQKFKAAPGIG